MRGGWPDRGVQDATPGGMTALLYAARDGRLDTVKAFLAATRKPDRESGRSQRDHSADHGDHERHISTSPGFCSIRARA